MWNICKKASVVGLVAVLLSFVLGCSEKGSPAAQVEPRGMEFCKNLWLGESYGESVAKIRSVVGRDTLVKTFVLRQTADFSRALPVELTGATVLQVPLKRVVTLSSAQIGYMLRLGFQDKIVAVGEGKYVADSALYARVQSGEVAEVGNGPTLSLENVVALKPDLVMSFATGGGHDDYERINALGLPLMLTSEWQEDSPLAKAEWIKLFGRLFGIEALADSIFEQSKNLYLQAANGGVAGVSPAREGSEQQRANGGGTSPHKSAQDDTIPHSTSHISHSPCPRVLVGMSYGGVWYAPGGNSYTARLIKDAGGCYLWASDTSRELQFSLEEIMLVADSADVWVNPGMFATPEDLLASEPRVKYIKAFKEKRVCQNDGRKGPGGGNDFYESAVVYPAEMLLNLRQCLKNATNGADSIQKEFDWYHNIFIF